MFCNNPKTEQQERHGKKCNTQMIEMARERERVRTVREIVKWSRVERRQTDTELLRGPIEKYQNAHNNY